MSATLRSKRDIVLTLASSGIVVLLMPGGRTAHSRFIIPLYVDEYSTCSIDLKNQLAQLIAKAKLVIWEKNTYDT